MTGHLQIELVADAAGRTFIRDQSFHAPMHLSKPHWDGQYLVVQAVNCTAGLFDGDRIDLRVESRSGSRALVTSPSAQRAHPARNVDAFARIEQHLIVETGAWLEVCPEIFIPHRGSRVWQTTRIDAARGAELFYLESLAPGRVGSGESFAYDRLEWLTEFRLAGERVVRERYSLAADSESVRLLQGDYPYYASGYLLSPQFPTSPTLSQSLAGFNDADIRIAASFPVPSLAVIKMLARNSLALRRGIQQLRALVYSNLHRPLPNWRKW